MPLHAQYMPARHAKTTFQEEFPMSLLRKRYALTALLIIVAVSSAGVAHIRNSDAEAASAVPQAQAAAVDVAPVRERSIHDQREYAGRLEAVDHVAIRPQVSGTITQVHFSDGSLVQAGDVLFTIDPRPYEAAVARARADLAASKARAHYTAAEFARAKRLLAQNAIARKDFDENSNAASVAKAQQQAAEAALASAELDLEHTQVTAPVSGRVSRAEVTEGNYVVAGSTAQALTTLVSVDKMYASFEVDEQSFLAFVQPSRMSRSEPTSVSMGLMNELGFPRQGKVASVDNRLDSASGTIRLRAIFDNADGMLVPGLYARIRLSSGTERNAVLVKETAIGTDQDKRFVLVVDQNERTAYREVKLGALREGMRVVEEGLQAGERVVVNGMQHVRPGDPVVARSVGPEAAKLADLGEAKRQAASKNAS